MDINNIAKQGLENILSQKAPNIVDVLFGRHVGKVVDADTLISEVKKRVTISVKTGVLYEGVAEDSEKFLRKHILEGINLVVLYVDLVGSTSIILKLPKDEFSKVITTFAQEMAYVIKRHEGFVLKFVGDAVIGYFIDHDSKPSADRAVSCAESMIKVIKLGLNPILKKSGLPELKIKIGMDYGEAIVVLYGNDVTNSHVDLIGPALNIGAKIQNLASPDQILIGEEVYARLHNSLKQYFLKLKMDKDTWNYKQGGSKKIYPVYAYAGKQNHS
ncbi:MAG TPA: adenylate/guanylate cyclase domain-containing protein [Nitrosopumilaceae archaeon]|nr:adenylate/guanylate cyclase domain-containing protein [Nitrosopumilaceae archaeon]